ncbi:MAG: methyl-accepting chemotaxis protein [Rhodospirillales bacterium]|nr:methyl-accepting chemotaxis protein [Rhodospirillales bacterium]
MLDHLKIDRKLTLLSLVFVIPAAFLAWLLIAQSNKDIDFAFKEELGSRYIAALRGLEVELTGSYAATSLDASAFASGQDRLETVHHSVGAEVGDSEVYPPILDAIKTLKAAAPGQRPGAYKDAVAAVRAAISRVGDASNLILDPDLDSFYAMDLAVVKLPELTDSSAQVLETALEAVSGAGDLARAAEFLKRKGAFQAAMDGTAGSLDAGYRGNADGLMKAALDKPFSALKEAVDAYGLALESLSPSAEPNLQKPDAKKLTELQIKAVQAADAMWKASLAELDRLLAARISGFKSKLAINLTAAALVLLAAFAFSIWLGRSISKSLNRLSKVMSELADGHLETEVPFKGRHDEVGGMARSVEIFKTGLQEAERLAAEQDVEHRLRAERAEKLRDLAKVFEGQVAGILADLGRSVERMENTSGGMSKTAEDTGVQASTVARAAESTTGSVQAVAAAAEELSASIDEIARQVSDASHVADQAVEQAEAANRTVQGLSTAAARISEVVTLINDIASQTNLLALNATIEAARAGEAGKGFAVVANEVKNLANQTGKATEDITLQVQGVQQATGEAVRAIEAILDIIRKISEISSAIATAVEEQGAATREIARNAEQAASAAGGMNATVDQVHVAAERAREAAGEIEGISTGLSKEASDIQGCVRQFLGGVNAA